MSSNKNNYGGFNDISDLIEDDDRPIRSRSDDLYKEHELLQFLDQEESRLKKLDTYFTRKYDNLVNTPQSKEIYKDLCSSVDHKKGALIKRLLPINSAVNQEFTQMWRSMFEIS